MHTHSHKKHECTYREHKLWQCEISGSAIWNSLLETWNPAIWSFSLWFWFLEYLWWIVVVEVWLPHQGLVEIRIIFSNWNSLQLRKGATHLSSQHIGVYVRRIGSLGPAQATCETLYWKQNKIQPKTLALGQSTNRNNKLYCSSISKQIKLFAFVLCRAIFDSVVSTRGCSRLRS